MDPEIKIINPAESLAKEIKKYLENNPAYSKKDKEGE